MASPLLVQCVGGEFGPRRVTEQHTLCGAPWQPPPRLDVPDGAPDARPAAWLLRARSGSLRASPNWALVEREAGLRLNRA